ncbi:hypothetical protein [Armatimonas rosea]|uniref:Alpha-1,2-mannosyltransferase n=1 Tax=Armatimonas rosea TaxID=685828 RepID=A0A7W9SQ82_ARMRO|nr:hypothetical protein [Armatimonas rosea]MBB6050008.1 hypothetical protein [Armatimonas rosea]
MTKKSELFFALVLFALVAGLSLVFQKPLTYHDGQGWDGVAYYQLAQQVAQHEPLRAIGPFAFRLGTPVLVGVLFPGKLLLGFKLVNLIGCLLSTVLLTFWLRRFVASSWLRLALVVGSLTQWHAPLRFTAHYAAYTDPWLFVFLLGGLLALPWGTGTPPAYPTSGAPATPSPSGSAFRGRRGGAEGRGGGVYGGVYGGVQSWWFVGLCFVGGLFRESVVVVPLALLLASRGRAWLPLLAGGLGIVATHLLAHQSDSYSFARTVGQWAYNKPLPVYLHGLFIAFGPALVLPIFFWRTAGAWLKGQPVLAWTLGIFLVLGWVGGSDTERIVYWAMPVVYALIGVILEKHALPRGFLIALVALQLLSHRIFWLLPDFPSTGSSPLPLFTPPTSTCQYPDLWSYQAERRIQLVALVEYLLVALGLWLWLAWEQRRNASRKPTS